MNEDFVVELWSIAIHRLETRQQGHSRAAIHLRRLLEQLQLSLDLRPVFILDTVELDRFATNKPDSIEEYLERLERCMDRASELPAWESRDRS